MARTVISRRRGLSWLGKPRKLRLGSSVEDFDPAEELADPDFINKAIMQAVSVGDMEAVRDILRAHLRVLNRSKAATHMDVSRQEVHRIIAGSRKPSLETLGAFMRMVKAERADAARA